MADTVTTIVTGLQQISAAQAAAQTAAANAAASAQQAAATASSAAASSVAAESASGTAQTGATQAAAYASAAQASASEAANTLANAVAKGGDVSSNVATPTGSSYSQKIADFMGLTALLAPNEASGYYGITELLSFSGTTDSAFGSWIQGSVGAWNGNVAFGIGALNPNNNNAQSGGQCGEMTAFGFGALGLIANAAVGTINGRCTAFGFKALGQNTGGTQNDAFGAQALMQLTSGATNAMFGSHAGRTITTGMQNVGFGHGSFGGNDTAPLAMTGQGNSGFGPWTLQNVTTGNYNFMGGPQAGINITTANNNIGLGSNSQYSNTTSSQNISVGCGALYSFVGNGGNTNVVAIGQGALYELTTGVYNVALGGSAGAGAGNLGSTIDQKCLFLGYAATRDASVAQTTQLTNMTVIGCQATGNLSNTVFLGNSSVTAAYIGGTSTSGSQILAMPSGGATASTSSTVTNKIKVTLGGTTFYLLASNVST